MSDPRWRVPPEVELHWRCWEGEYVVFHPDSGDVHLLNPLAGEALKALEIGPVGAEDLARCLAARRQGTDARELTDPMAELLATFDELGLIEPVADAPQPVA